MRAFNRLLPSVLTMTALAWGAQAAANFCRGIATTQIDH